MKEQIICIYIKEQIIYIYIYIFIFIYIYIYIIIIIIIIIISTYPIVILKTGLSKLSAQCKVYNICIHI